MSYDLSMDPCHFGWQHIGSILMPERSQEWMPAEYTISCECKKRCNTRCRCAKLSFGCTEYCKCGGGCEKDGYDD